MGTAQTKQQILDTAERLFSAKGFAATSLRDITGEAGVNLAAVHYHYKSKEALLQAVFTRRMEGINGIRTARLEACLSTLGAGGQVSLEEALRAIVEPVMTMRHDESLGGEVFARLLGRAMFEPEPVLLPILYREFKGVFLRFTEVMQRVLPAAPAGEIFWRMHFLAGAMSFYTVNPRHLRMTSGGQCDPDDTTEAVRQLVAFAAGGFRASQV